MEPLNVGSRRVNLLVACALAAALGLGAGPARADAKGLTARGSVEQVQVTGAAKGAQLTLFNRRGKRVDAQRAGALGGVVFREVAPGSGYRVRTRAGTTTKPFAVLSQRSTPPSTKAYDQKLPAGGYGYVTTRDGTQLAIDVHLPIGATGSGPFPTLVEYSGYGYANPAGGESSIATIANLLGYAVVDVNMRGTGCSGGAFDYFEPLQGLDGYDVIETVARQPWALHHKVGMMGISYGGISQLFTAATAPPSLAAITPLSVIDNTATTLYPGGILNSGFALSWAKDRVHDAKPASRTGGQAWALKRIQEGDQTCKANQVLHAAAVDLLKKTHDNRYYVPSVADPLAPATFVHKIKVPTYLACQWTDEQTGGHCATLASRFTGTTRKWFTFTNGTHIDSLDPATFNRWYDFLELYVARRAPNLAPALKAAAPTIFATAMGVPGVQLPDDPIQGRAGYADAKAAFEALPPVRILFDNGAGGATAGAPVAGFEQSFARFPLPGTRAQSWYLGAGGALTDAAPAGAGGRDAFTWSRSARPATSFTGDTAAGAGGLWTAAPPYRWLQPPAGSALSYVSAPLSASTAVVGAGALQAWVKASAPSVDLQVTVSEVRPDGAETFVQGGWLRASRRKLDPRKSTLLEPVPSLTRADASPLPAGRFAEVNVPLYYQGHVYRAGSSIRITISAPGGDQPVWAFGDTTPAKGAAAVTLAYAKGTPSRLILPVVPGIAVPTALPLCPSLRGEPCRAYVPFANRAG
ncbi:MAG TPA: CocE/NonD family hydrolase [Baekduia sp.]|uniref:CocE/NonD family hydrolase n=1 Tax=Baekduia sp. TaxID=2600305 RepID=UPI002B9B4D0F|nr:CocE/NonD family hydrolase [Baekduia sp.]HMJ35525.1 CocE/NonD family hydrolase [Baekduia sp.]